MVVPVDLLHNAISLHISLPSTCSHKLAYITHIQEKASATFVGFANLPNQVFRKSVKRGFQFSLMVVGKRMFCAIQVVHSLTAKWFLHRPERAGEVNPRQLTFYG